MSSIATWAVIGGIVGARLYHVVTDWNAFSSDLSRIPMIWKGGLGIPGGLLGGVLCGVYRARRRGVWIPELLTAAAPAIPLAQSIGRWGNWWNQELFGRATTLPWALQISDDKLPAGYSSGTTFHPTFLYESRWNLALCLVLIQIDRRMSLRPGRLFAVYLAGYFSGASGSKAYASTRPVCWAVCVSTSGSRQSWSLRRLNSSLIDWRSRREAVARLMTSSADETIP